MVASVSRLGAVYPSAQAAIALIKHAPVGARRHAAIDVAQLVQELAIPVLVPPGNDADRHSRWPRPFQLSAGDLRPTGYGLNALLHAAGNRHDRVQRPGLSAHAGDSDPASRTSNDRQAHRGRYRRF